ncbi:deoxyribonuclease V [Hymenobacter sp. H14-R3]|uniref:deoxyribonuclease V n=1 Tax=Hymenobacter sp. H14-R3 TaxID=3046308 RepID=UPI0024BBC467|nr:deoxyribonuclease V [Hymenobacter sp. H14-R3]MDJ0365606.1 deoxyribonuclease V [Hymenobacter sp. H14-R3]
MAYYRPPGPPPDPELVRSLTAQQNELRQRVRTEPLPHEPHLIAGCDSSFPTPDTILSVFVVLKFPSLELVEKVYSYGPVTMPYVSGFLSFREAPNVIQAFAKLTHRPDVVMVDGHGIAHPRRVGIGAHLGVLLDLPTFGVAKQKLTGTFQEPAPEKGSITPLTDAKTGELIGEVIRSKDKILPLFVSPGHRCDQATATRLTLACLRGYKLPEPTRLADYWAEQFKKEVR